MIFRSPSPQVAIPEVSWPEYFLGRIAAYGQRPALINAENGAMMTFRELHAAIRNVSSAMQNRGYGKGNVFAIYAPNSPDFVIAFQAILAFGGIVTTVNPLYTGDELRHQLRHAGAVCLLTIPALLDKAGDVLESTAVREVIVFGSRAGAPSFQDLVREAGGESVLPDIDAGRDTAVLPYSSGTTGLPKGVMLSHHNLVAHNVLIENQQEIRHLGLDDRVLAVLPFFHIFGMTVVMNLCLSNGGALVILPGFEPAAFLQSIQEYRVTRAYLVPPIILFLADHPLVGEYDISSLNYILSGAAPLGRDQVIRTRERIQCPIHQGYGMTEASPATHIMPDLSPLKKEGSAGVLVPNTEARIIDTATGVSLGHNETGELLVRGPQVMPGYLDDPEATAATVDNEGWLHTGDVAYADEDGFFYIVDRVKELIKYKGYQVAPAELEALLLTHPAVQDAAVVPCPDREAGEIPRAFVVADGDTRAGELMDWVADRVAGYKKIRRLEFTDRIPRSASGKILRRELRGR